MPAVLSLLVGGEIVAEGETVPARIYLAGPTGSGKTTLAAVLEREYGFVRVSMGGLCRRIAAVFGLRGDRHGLQAVGDMLRYLSGPSALAELAAREALAARRVVVDGVRLHAEAEYLRARGWRGIRLECSEADRAARLRARDGEIGDNRLSEHATEQEARTVAADVVLTVVAHEAMALAVAHVLHLLGEDAPA
jgi:dephospho-CoA kinase